MSAARKRGHNPTASQPAGKAPARAAGPGDAPRQFPAHPLQPQRKLLAVLSVLFALWIAFLVTLYFKTVHPRRSVAPQPDARGNLDTDAASEPSH